MNNNNLSLPFLYSPFLLGAYSNPHALAITAMNVTNNVEQCQVSVVIDGSVGTPSVVVVIDGKAYTATYG